MLTIVSGIFLYLFLGILFIKAAYWITKNTYEGNDVDVFFICMSLLLWPLILLGWLIADFSHKLFKRIL